MEKSIFAGLTILDEDEPINTGGGAFAGRDRETIDRALELGVVTHRHDARAGLGDPDAPFLGASAVASAGTIPAGNAYALAYSLEDNQSGETLISPTITLSTPSPLDEPSTTPTASADYSTGELPVDTYYYAISHIDGEGGETPVGPAVAAEREPGYANARILLSGLTADVAAASAAGWRLYRAVGGGDFNYLGSGIVDNYTDDGSATANCDLEPLPDDINTTNGSSSFLIALPSAGGVVADADFINLYLSEGGAFEGDTLLEQFPVGSAGQTVLYRNVETLEGQPQDVNTSWGGASLIDPDTELLDWHWKRPVASAGALGSGELADVRLSQDSGKLYAMLQDPSGSVWTQIGSGALAAEDNDGPTIEGLQKLQFVGSGGTGVSVTDLGGGSGQVLISGGGGGGGGGMAASALLDVTDSDGPDVTDIGKLEFVGSGGAGVSVTDLGNGSARVTVGAGAGGGGGMGASALLDVSDADGPDIPNIGHLTFAASGDASVGLSDLGNGSAQVMIAASGLQGPSGPPGADGSDGASGAAGAQGPAGTGNSSITAIGEGGIFAAASAIAFAASGAASVSASDLGGGSAQVLVAPHGRRWGSATVSSLAGSGSAAVQFNGAAGMRILALNTDRQARVRGYADGAASASDQARAIGTDPTGDHGVLLDFRTTPDDLAWRLTPAVDAHNLQEAPVNGLPLIVTNLDGTSEDVTVAFLYIPTEVV